MDTNQSESEVSNKLRPIEFFVIFSIGLLVGAVLCAKVGIANEREALRLDAIKHGAAHWVSAPDGHPVFVWNAKDEN